MATAVHAEIHHFNGETNDLDDDGDIRLGFYFILCDSFDLPIIDLMGPYGTALEAETACQREYDNGGY